MPLQYSRGRPILAAILLGALSMAPALAHDGPHHTAVAADEVAFKPGPASLPPGAEIAVLHGDPSKEGQFVFRLKFPAGYEIPPHRHPKEEHVTVISGGFGMSTGETFDSGAAPLLPAGGFVRIPVGEAHFAWTEEATVVQLNGIGPWGVEYLNPDDDPRNQ